jgi:hypothetical protein
LAPDATGLLQFAEEFAQTIGRFIVHRLGGVGVDPQCQPRISVTKAIGHNLHRHAEAEQFGSMAVPEIVEAADGQSCASD